MAITSKETRETLERWQFDVRLEDTPTYAQGKENAASVVALLEASERCSNVRCRPEGATPAKGKVELTEDQVQKDIQAIMRNITSTVAFLPALRDKCLLFHTFHSQKLTTSKGAFTILAYTDKDTEVPSEWMDSDPHGIKGNAEQVSPPPARQ